MCTSLAYFVKQYVNPRAILRAHSPRVLRLRCFRQAITKRGVLRRISERKCKIMLRPWLHTSARLNFLQIRLP